MSFLDTVVGQAFRNDKAGRVVVFTGDRKNRGYIVRSETDELKIKSFLKMFYFAHFSIFLLGSCLTYAWSIFLVDLHVFRRASEDFVRIFAFFLGINCILVWIPDFLLWRSYRRALSNFVSAQDQVEVASWPANQRWKFVVLGIMAAALGILVATLWLVRSK